MAGILVQLDKDEEQMNRTSRRELTSIVGELFKVKF